DVAKRHPLLHQPGMHAVRKLLLEKALPFYKRFRDAGRDDPKAREELADQYFRVGYITDEIGNKVEARKAYDQSRDIMEKLAKANPKVTLYQSDLAATLNNLGTLLSDEGKRTEALAAYTQARDIGARLVKDHPKVTKYQHDLAAALTNMG